MLILDAKMTNLPYFKHNLNFPLKNPLQSLLLIFWRLPQWKISENLVTHFWHSKNFPNNTVFSAYDKFSLKIQNSHFYNGSYRACFF